MELGVSVSSTHRLLPYFFTVISLVVIGAIFSEPLIAVSIVMASIAIFMRYYTALTTAAIAKTVPRVEAGATVEGDELRVDFELRNTTRVPILLAEYSLSYSPLLRLLGPSRAGLALIPPSSMVRLSFRFMGRAGTYRIGPLKVVVRDPLGLFRSDEVKVSDGIVVRVPPRVEEVVVRRLWVYTRTSGLARSRLPGEGVEFYDIREYRPGDELRSIVWRVFASRGTLAVRESERESFQYVLFVVDSTRDMWIGPPRQTPVEHFLKIVASVAYYLSMRGYSISSIVFNEKDVASSGKPATGSAGFFRVYTALSRAEYVEAGLSIGDIFSSLMTRLTPLIPRERTIVFLFTRPVGVDREDFVVGLARILGSRGHLVFLVTPLLVSYELSDVPRIARGLYQLKLYEVLRQDLESIKKLRSLGVRVVALLPTHIPQRVVRIVEELV